MNQSLQWKTEQPVLAVELENQLIHFSHARKLSKGDASPVSHKAKQTADYVRSLETADLPRLYECYAQLCQYTHPAAHSVSQLLIPLSPEKFQLFPGQDRLRIDGFIKEYNSLLIPLLMIAFNPGALILKVLLYFDVPEFHSQGINLFDLRGISAARRDHESETDTRFRDELEILRPVTGLQDFSGLTCKSCVIL